MAHGRPIGQLLTKLHTVNISKGTVSFKIYVFVCLRQRTGGLYARKIAGGQPTYKSLLAARVQAHYRADREEEERLQGLIRSLVIN